MCFDCSDGRINQNSSPPVTDHLKESFSVLPNSRIFEPYFLSAASIRRCFNIESSRCFIDGMHISLSLSIANSELAMPIVADIYDYTYSSHHTNMTENRPTPSHYREDFLELSLVLALLGCLCCRPVIFLQPVSYLILSYHYPPVAALLLIFHDFQRREIYVDYCAVINKSNYCITR